MRSINQGELLLLKRKREGLNQEDFAKKTGISLSSIKRYENSTDIKAKALRAICEAMKWDISEFYESTPAMVAEESEKYVAKNYHSELIEMQRKYIALLEKYRLLEEELFALKKKPKPV